MNPFLKFDCRFGYESGFELDAAFETSNSVTGLLGPSGSGKTTVLQLIAGLLRPTDGAISIDGDSLIDTAGNICKPPEKRRVGLLFQDQHLFPHLRVRDNIQFGYRRSDSQAGPSLDAVVATLELQDLLLRFPATLSGGQKQRVALARALLSRPKILLLDEPLSAVEDELRERIVKLVETISTEFAIPILLVSHNVELVHRLSSQIIQMKNGRVVKDENEQVHK